jgi:hypothetical protein
VPEERPVPDPWAIKAVKRPVNEDIRPPKAAKRTANPARVLNPRRSLCDVGEIADGYGRCCASNHTEAQECSRYQGCLCIRHVHSSRFVSRLSQQPGQMAEFPIRDKKPPKSARWGGGEQGGSRITWLMRQQLRRATRRRLEKGRLDLSEGPEHPRNLYQRGDLCLRKPIGDPCGRETVSRNQAAG